MPRLVFIITLLLSTLTVRSQELTISPQLLRGMAQHIQQMHDYSNTFSVARYLEEILSEYDFQRITISDTEWSYGKDIGLKEIAGGFVYDFHSPSSIVFRVANYGKVTCEVLFKDHKLAEIYRRELPSLGFVNPDATVKPEVFVQIGGTDDFTVTDMADDGLCSVAYHACPPTISDNLQPADIANFLGKPIEEVREKTSELGYEEVQTHGNATYFVRNCVLSGSRPLYKYSPVEGYEFSEYSALVINTTDNRVTSARLNLYHSDRLALIYGLARCGFLQVSQKRKVAHYQSEDKTKHAKLERLNDDSWSVLVKNARKD